jgi:tetratricopeptide (TPR) repeat protein
MSLKRQVNLYKRAENVVKGSTPGGSKLVATKGSILLATLHNRASSDFLSALKLNPWEFSACQNLGNICVIRSDWDNAIYYYKETLKIKPDYAPAYNNLCGAYERKREKAMALSGK